MTTFVKNLVDEKFNLFNVDLTKCPVDRNGKKMRDWINKTYEELVKEHDYNSNLWGLSLGEQTNGRCIMSLDFDIYDKDTDGIDEETNKLKLYYLENCKNQNGIYTSSTEGNLNVLVDYTNSQIIKDFVKQLNATKFKKFELEILVKGNQVIPPTQTTCKKTKKLGNPRTFKNAENPFYIIEDGSCFTFNFIKDLFEEKLKPIKKEIKTVKIRNEVKTNDETDNETNDENDKEIDDKYLDLLFNTIKNENNKKGKRGVDWDDWFKIAGILKHNEYTEDDFVKYTLLNPIGNATEARTLWKGIKNNKSMSIFGLQTIAKKINPNGFKCWLKKWNIYGISFNEVNDPYSCACKIKNTLNTTLKLCKENWYMLTDNQLWKQQKEPTFYIIKEIHKYLDHEKDLLNYKSSKAEGEEKKSLITQMENWLKLYSVITKSGYLSVLTKTLRPLLTDDDFESKLDNNKGFLVFKNGIMDLSTKLFREGIMWDDFVTETIPYDYKQSETSYIKSILIKILNNNQEHLNYYLSLLGYSFTGNADSEKAVYFMIDKTEDGKGDNGKTFFFDILNDLLPNYVYKSKSSFILKKNTKAHKQLAEMKGKRLVWLEELPTEETNAELIKEIADGKSTENEVMFGTSEKINIMFKMFVLSNNIPNIKSNEEAVYNRYKQVSFNSHFDRTGDRVEENAEKLEFVADTKLSQIIKEQYYNEVFNLIIEYANNYYKNGLPKIPQQFLNDTNETKTKNNKFSSWFSENCEKDEDGKVALDHLVYMSSCNKDDIKSFLKKMGFKYDKDLSGLGKNNKGKAYKGGYVGIKISENEEEE